MMESLLDGLFARSWSVGRDDWFEDRLDQCCRTDRKYQEEWINTHVQVAQKTLKKPLVLEEFGKKLKEQDPVKVKKLVKTERDPIFESTYQIVESAMQK